MERYAELSRVTGETDIKAAILLDGVGKTEINTGIGFFNHMLSLFGRHGLFDLVIDAKGDLDVDYHHTVEDVGIVLGQVIKQALGEKKSIIRYGTEYVPMDETLVLVSLDISGRPFLVFDVSFEKDKVGEFDTELTEEFLRAVAFNAGITLHVKLIHGKNTHHIIEAIFKAFARALSMAVSIDMRIEGVMSTKGIL